MSFGRLLGGEVLQQPETDFRIPISLWANDIMDSQVKSLDGNRYDQVLTNHSFFAEV